jgi:hypothetical protein
MDVLQVLLSAVNFMQQEVEVSKMNGLEVLPRSFQDRMESMEGKVFINTLLSSWDGRCRRKGFYKNVAFFLLSRWHNLFP